MASIQPLPVEVVNLIAAGEVIDSLAAALRELVENSLDAGATRIAVSLWPDLWRLRVADNGSGMDLANLERAATAHATSKIQALDDLRQITSLGFRGEALHSLAQLSNLDIRSCTPGDEAWRVVYNSQGKAVQVEPAAIAPGTIVTVSDLFGGWPVRRDFTSPAQQLRMVQLTIEKIALCHPQVTWRVEKSDRPWFAISPGKTAKQILPQIVRGVEPSDLQYLSLALGDPSEDSSEKNSTQALKASAALLRDNQSEENFSRVLEATEAYGEEQFGEDSPKALEAREADGQERLEEDSAQTDIKEKLQKDLATELPGDNRKENKTGNSLSLAIGLPDRCHRRRPDWVKVAVNGRLVRSPELEQTAIGAFGRTLPRDRYPLCFLELRVTADQIDWNRHPAKEEIYLQNLGWWQQQIKEAIAHALRLNAEAAPTAAQDRIAGLLKASEEKGSYQVGGSQQEKASNPLQLRAIAQVHNTYILAEHTSGIWLVEQHIAHERVLYEELQNSWQLVPLEPPAILARLSKAQLEQLERLELDTSEFGDRLWAVRSAPELLVDREDCIDALYELSLAGDLEAAQVATACRSAIRNGTPLTLPEMQDILDRWQHTRNPRTCPHGRPIYLSLEETDLARFFRRHWVIGKSHGI